MFRVLRAFEAAGLEYVLIGATAMGFHGLVRATEDVDLFVRATADNIERLTLLRCDDAIGRGSKLLHAERRGVRWASRNFARSSR